FLFVAGCRYGTPVGPAPARPPEATHGSVIPDGIPLADYDYLRQRHIRVPVADVEPARIPDSFNDARDGKRLHHAVDILAPKGTPVLAADDGFILKLRTGGAGGVTIYAVDPEERFVYYYAHLDHRRKGISEGDRVARGDTIGFVGTSGNAPKDTPHLHFQIMLMPPDHKWWTGIPVNPRPLFVE
ncbi:MAG: M23 family metallopeptidase, partial [Gemmatimonadaceae bacterium]|nr:M23 family metallopeptidase [Gemmatimonadaceae bacterium]